MGPSSTKNPVGSRSAIPAYRLPHRRRLLVAETAGYRRPLSDDTFHLGQPCILVAGVIPVDVVPMRRSGYRRCLLAAAVHGKTVG